MANNYDKILELANANNMGLSNTIKRDFGIPLDFTSVQASYEAALTYAATNTLAYVGQPISVGDKLYIVTAESQGKYPAEGENQIDVFLAEVGSATEGDGSTIDLKDGVLSLHGIDGKTTGTYVPTLVNGVLTWNEPDNTTIEGLTASIDALETRADALELTVNGKAAVGEEGSEDYEPAVEGLTDKVAKNASAIETEKEARETAISTETTAREEAIEAIHNLIGSVTEDTTVVDMIAAAEQSAKNAIPTDVSKFTNDANYQSGEQVSASISAAIASKADKDSVYTKDEVDTKIGDLEDTIAGITHFTTKIVASTDEVTEVGVLYLIKDETVSGADKYNEYLFIEGTGAVLIGDTTTDLSDYVTNTALATELAKYTTTEGLTTLLSSYVTTDKLTEELLKKVDSDTYASDKETFAVKTTVEQALNLKADASALDSYYTKTAANELLDAKADKSTMTTELGKKVETAQITHTSESVAEGVTKDGTALTIVVDSYRKSEVYTKSETDNQIDAKIASVTGGESAADVKLALESYRDALNTEIWGPTASTWTTTTEVDGKTVVTYTPQYGTTSRVDTLESDVATLKTNVATAQTTADGAVSAIAALENGQVKLNKEAIATLTGIVNGTSSEDTTSISYRVGALESANTTHATEFSNLKAKVDTAVDTTIPALTTRVEGTETSIGTINETIQSLTQLVGTKADTSAVYNKGEVDGFISALQSSKADAESVYTKTEVDSLLLNLDQTELENGIKANASAIAILNGVTETDTTGDTGKSVRTIAKEEVAAVVGAAPDALDTLEEIASWIQNDETGAAAISNTVALHSGYFAGIGGQDQPATVIGAINAAIEAIPAYELPVATGTVLGGVLSATDTVVDGVTTKASNAVYVESDGKMSVRQITTDILVNGEEEFIINGGSASV